MTISNSRGWQIVAIGLAGAAALVTIQAIFVTAFSGFSYDQERVDPTSLQKTFEQISVGIVQFELYVGAVVLLLNLVTTIVNFFVKNKMVIIITSIISICMIALAVVLVATVLLSIPPAKI